LITIDQERGTVSVVRDGATETYELGEPEGFRIVSDAWLRAGWDAKLVYTFTWLGRPIIQLPEDMFRVQELVWRLRPDVIVETGVAHGGSLVFYAGLCRLMGNGRVVGVDVEIRPHNRAAIEDHPLADLITLVEGDSSAEETAARVAALCEGASSVLVLLDSDHSREHVRRELETYSQLVTVGSYIVAMDGSIMELVRGGPRTKPDWDTNNPAAAVHAFAAEHTEFQIDQPAFAFNESGLSSGTSYFSNGWLRRVR
jgi:cephalosporin hydroxylase